MKRVYEYANTYMNTHADTYSTLYIQMYSSPQHKCTQQTQTHTPNMCSCIYSQNLTTFHNNLTKFEWDSKDTTKRQTDGHDRQTDRQKLIQSPESRCLVAAITDQIYMFQCMHQTNQMQCPNVSTRKIYGHTRFFFLHTRSLRALKYTHIPGCSDAQTWRAGHFPEGSA